MIVDYDSNALSSVLYHRTITKLSSYRSYNDQIADPCLLGSRITYKECCCLLSYFIELLCRF